MRPVKARCPECQAAVETEFALPRIMQLSADESAFLAEFILAGFSIKQLEKNVSLSYPAIRARLDRIIEHMRRISSGPQSRKAVLDRLEAGEIRTDEAIRLIEAL